MAGQESLDRRPELSITKSGGDEVAERRLVAGLRIGPRRVLLGFPDCLQHELGHPVLADWPGADQSLIQQVLSSPIWPAAAAMPTAAGLVPGVQLGPGFDGRVPG